MFDDPEKKADLNTSVAEKIDGTHFQGQTSRERPKSAPYPRLKNSKRTSNFQVLVNWEHLRKKKNFEKSPTMPKKTEREDPLVSSGIVCYAGNLFGSVPWANRYNLASSQNFVELLVELFWSVQVYFGLKKTLTKSHDYSRLFSQEKRRLKSHGLKKLFS